MRVDGTDPLAVYNLVRDAAAKARTPGEDDRRPTLVEAVLYRVAAHNTTDDPSNYQESGDEADRDRWRDRDPIPRFETFLRETGRLDDDRDTEIEDWIETELKRAVEAAEATESDPDEMFEHVYADLDDHDRLRAQQAELAVLRERYGDDALTED